MNITIKSLRQSGYKVRVLHDRYLQIPSVRFDDISSKPVVCKNSKLTHLDAARKEGFEVGPKGGKTVIELTVPQGSGIRPKIVTGVAECNLADNYCKRTGINIALGRAIKQFTNTELVATD